MDCNLKIALAGEGGQGVQAVAEIFAAAAYSVGLQALYIPNFGVEQRGGVSVAFVQVSTAPVSAPKFATGDIVVALSRRAVERVRQYVDAGSLLIYEADLEDDVQRFYGDRQKQLAVPALAIAREEMHPRVFNVIILGALAGITGFLKEEDVKQALERHLGHKFSVDPSLKELNYRALARGYGLGRQKREDRGREKDPMMA